MSDKLVTAQDEGRSPSPGFGPAVEFGLDQVRLAIRGIRYGEVRVIIQDGVVVQIERVEKQRLR